MSVTLTDIVSYKRLVAAGNDKLYFEDINVTVGTMVELASASNSIDTSDQLIMFELHQKVFIVNGAKLRVADFTNIRITHSVLATAHAHGDVLTQATTTATAVVDFTDVAKTHTYVYVVSGTFTPASNQITGSGSGTAFTPTGINGRLTHTVLTTAHASGDVLTQATSGATMTVEYTDAAKTHTWGRITNGIFTTTYLVSGSGSGTAFTPTAVNTSPPLMYDWTVYAGAASGSMPAKAYLGAAYRGRAVLSGNPNTPEQWYMSRQNNPWDWQYIAADAQAPIAGGDFEAGKIGDIIRALIPFRNDFLILGCASSMQIIIGDPAEGGSMNALDQTTGIFGALSWCFDGEGNLWFWGSNGLYMTTLPAAPVCVSLQNLPNLIKDEAANPATHRITMGYDRKRNGLLITITTLATGVNSNYFYDFSTKGFFPEIYPEECGVYSQCFYAANTETYRDLLLGCKDGYIRRFDETEENDNIGATEEAITSYVTFGALPLFDGEYEGVISSLDVITGGGQTGDNTDSNNIGYKIWAGPSAEETLEKFDNDSIPNLAGTILASGVRGRGSRDPRKVRGIYATIKLYNNTLSQTWSFERLNIHVEGGD